MAALKFEGLNTEDNKAWKLKRIAKGISQSSKELLKYVQVKQSHISMWENEKATMAEEKVERYKRFIEAYPDIEGLMKELEEQK